MVLAALIWRQLTGQSAGESISPPGKLAQVATLLRKFAA